MKKGYRIMADALNKAFSSMWKAVPSLLQTEYTINGIPVYLKWSDKNQEDVKYNRTDIVETSITLEEEGSARLHWNVFTGEIIVGAHFLKRNGLLNGVREMIETFRANRADEYHKAQMRPAPLKVAVAARDPEQEQRYTNAIVNSNTSTYDPQNRPVKASVSRVGKAHKRPDDEAPKEVQHPASFRKLEDGRIIPVKAYARRRRLSSFSDEEIMAAVSYLKGHTYKETKSWFRITYNKDVSDSTLKRWKKALA